MVRLWPVDGILKGGAGWIQVRGHVNQLTGQDRTGQGGAETLNSSAPIYASVVSQSFCLGKRSKRWCFWCTKSRGTRLGSNDGELEAWRADSTATERPNREAPVRRRFHELCANLHTTSSSAYRDIAAALTWGHLSASLFQCVSWKNVLKFASRLCRTLTPRG